MTAVALSVGTVAVAPQALAADCGNYSTWYGDFYYRNCGNSPSLIRIMHEKNLGPVPWGTRCVGVGKEIRLGNAISGGWRAQELQGPCRP
ncbi:hypothetical protein [Crossiella cryophila]|uniref:Uncharacterized protein n=1 Tax=Crossiella cryophila TaxID=43355 RepID=A0A7W7FWT3_9PSEU|nr:hypothetical protein [Crossiella cryophila]MBB4679928.1 hypothetical protein [Crossiella cryophila]